MNRLFAPAAGCLLACFSVNLTACTKPPPRIVEEEAFDTSNEPWEAGNGGISVPDVAADPGKTKDTVDTNSPTELDAKSDGTRIQPPDTHKDVGAFAKQPPGLAWPIACVPGFSCHKVGLPDIDGNNIAYDCGKPGYAGHTGVDIAPTATMLEAGVTVHAAADGVVVAVRDDMFDQCPDPHPQCQPPTWKQSFASGTNNWAWCTETGFFCDYDGWGCFLCFGGNTILVRHDGWATAHSTMYGHIAKGSAQVKVGDHVSRGQVLAKVGSSGKSEGPHLHFEVNLTGYFDPVDPYAGPCGSNQLEWMWQHKLPWAVTPTDSP